jgi:hypothetical protein
VNGVAAFNDRLDNFSPGRFRQTRQFSEGGGGLLFSVARQPDGYKNRTLSRGVV